jgi:hypothetical protein
VIGGLILAVLAALLLFSDLNQPLLDPDEGRQAEIPREMLAHDNLLVPRMLGQPYYDKPPLQYWLTAGAYSLFGLRPWVARLVPTMAAWLVVLLTYVWGQRNLGARTAFLGGLGLCLTPGFVILGRMVILDSLLTACVVASWYAAHTAVNHPALRWRWWLLSALTCGLGILAKGPVALALLVPPVFGYQFLTTTAARPRWLAWNAYLGLAVLVAAPWYTAMAVSEPDYLEHFFWKANVLRFVNPYDHEHAWWFYVPVVFGFTLPWSLLWPALGYFLWSRSRRLRVLRSPGLGFCLLAMTWCLLFYSLSGCKSPPYVVPALVPLALLLGACIEAILFHLGKRHVPILDYAREVFPRRAALLMLLLSLGCSLATVWLDWQDWLPALAEMIGISLAIAVWWRYGRRASPALAWSACAAATLALLVLATRDLVEGFASRHTPASIARIVRRWPTGPQSFVVSYGRQWPSASFYLRREAMLFCPEAARQALLDSINKLPETLVLVESGPLLDDLLAAIPPTLETEVHRPEKIGQVALLVVRQRGQAFSTSSFARQP